MEGTIKRVMIDRGFGFIEPSGAGKDVFFHWTELADGVGWDETLPELRVAYQIRTTSKGPMAIRVRPIN